MIYVYSIGNYLMFSCVTFIEENTWKIIDTSETIQPSPRSAPTFVLDKLEKKIHLFGGANDQGHLDDYYTYSIEHQMWEL